MMEFSAMEGVIISMLLLTAGVFAITRKKTVRYRFMRSLTALLMYLVLVIIALFALVLWLPSADLLRESPFRIAIALAHLPGLLLCLWLSGYVVKERGE